MKVPVELETKCPLCRRNITIIGWTDSYVSCPRCRADLYIDLVGSLYVSAESLENVVVDSEQER